MGQGRREALARGNRRLGWAGGASLCGKADPLNLFVVVEGGNCVTGRWRSVHGHPLCLRFALQWWPQFSPDGRYVYFGSRDGWITKYDLYNLVVVAEVPLASTCATWGVGLMGPLCDGRELPAAQRGAVDSDLKLIKLPGPTLDGARPRACLPCTTQPPRKSFVVA